MFNISQLYGVARDYSDMRDHLLFFGLSLAKAETRTPINRRNSFQIDPSSAGKAP